MVELLEHLQLAVSLNIFYEISEHFLQRGVTEWSNVQSGPNVMLLEYSPFICCHSQKVSTPYSKGVAVASSAAQLLIQSATCPQMVKLQLFCMCGSKRQIYSCTFVVLKIILKIPAPKVFTTL